MNIQDLINKLETIPKNLRDREIQIFSDSGQKFSVREDISQFMMYGKVIQLLVKEEK